MTVLMLVAIAWLAFAAWRGYRRGFWRVLAGALGLLAGYLVLFFWGASLANRLSDYVPGLLGWPLSAMVIFSVASLVFAVLLRPLAKLGERQFVVSLTGAGLNVAIATVMIAGAIWGLSFLIGAKPTPLVLNAANSLGYYQSSALVEGSHRLVAFFVDIGLRLIGAPETGSELVKRISRSPAEGIHNLQEVGQSTETQNLFHSQDLQSVLRAGNSHAVAEHPDFIAFANQPSLQMLVGRQGQVDREAMAEQLVTVWQHIDAVKNSPQVKEVLNDPEIQALIESGNSAKLIAHPKLKPLLQAVMAQFNAPSVPPHSKAGIETIAPSTSNENDNNVLQSAESQTSALYLWRDANGRVSYSTWDKIPKEYRPYAQAIHH